MKNCVCLFWSYQLKDAELKKSITPHTAKLHMWWTQVVIISSGQPQHIYLLKCLIECWLLISYIINCAWLNVGSIILLWVNLGACIFWSVWLNVTLHVADTIISLLYHIICGQPWYMYFLNYLIEYWLLIVYLINSNFSNHWLVVGYIISLWVNSVATQ